MCNCSAYISYIKNISKNKPRINITPSAPNIDSESFSPLSQRLIGPSATNNSQVSKDKVVYIKPSANTSYSNVTKNNHIYQKSTDTNEFADFLETECNNIFGCGPDELYNRCKLQMMEYKKLTDYNERKLLLIKILNYDP